MSLSDPRRQTIAILYQALPPPLIDGLRKDAKPGGYSDSGADMAVALRKAGCTILTPVADPDPAVALDWVFPDTPEGIDAALAGGATLLWANTVLFDGHPIEAASHRAWIVGPAPAQAQAIDDKLATNALLAAAGLPVARSFTVTEADIPYAMDRLGELGLALPVCVKPIRGRGSQGVTVARDEAALLEQLAGLIGSGRFGDTAMVEQFLPGIEITVPVMPPRDRPGDSRPWALPPVVRFDQQDDIAPYNGDVPVTENSRAMTLAEYRRIDAAAAMVACEEAARLLDIRAPMRIDCRQDASGRYVLFDVNAKPNNTGPGRPGRDDQASLMTIAAAAIDWTFTDFLMASLRCAWTNKAP